MLWTHPVIKKEELLKFFPRKLVGKKNENVEKLALFYFAIAA